MTGLHFVYRVIGMPVQIRTRFRVTISHMFKKRDFYQSLLYLIQRTYFSCFGFIS